MSDKINILIADDHQMFLDGLKLIFSNIPAYNIVAEAKNGSEVIAAFNYTKIDLAILDINMPSPNGFETCKIINQNYPDCKVIMLTMYTEENFIREFSNSQASAYIIKNAGKAELIKAIEVAMIGGKYISAGLNKLNDFPIQDNFSKEFSLTKREIEIIGLLVQEKSSLEIAELLFISAFTVNTHRKNILKKLDIKNTAGIVKFAVQNGLINN